MPIIDIFVYGTLRTDYTGPNPNYGNIVRELAPDHVVSGDPGSWTLYDHGLYCVRDDGRIGIPAIGPVTGQTVTGDVIRVNAADFTALCRYESFPNLYQLSGVEVANSFGTWRQAFAFMPNSLTLSSFGYILPSGDYMNPGLTVS